VFRWEISLPGNKKPSLLSEGCALVLDASNAEVLVSYQRADQLLRAFRAFRRYP
jgi:hypothetical protein